MRQRTFEILSKILHIYTFSNSLNILMKGFFFTLKVIYVHCRKLGKYSREQKNHLKGCHINARLFTACKCCLPEFLYTFLNTLSGINI